MNETNAELVPYELLFSFFGTCCCLIVTIVELFD